MSKRKIRPNEGEQNGEEYPKLQAFNIICIDQNETVVVVSPQDAIKMEQGCEYFSKAFEYGTVEAGTRTITKADWTSMSDRTALSATRYFWKCGRERTQRAATTICCSGSGTLQVQD
jgi:hypothetical protein